MSALPAEPAPSRCRVLVADPLPLYASALASVLTARGYEVSTAHSAMAAMYAGWNLPVDLIVCAEALPDEPGFRLLRWCRQHKPSVAVILLGDADDDRVRYAAIKAGAAAYLPRQLPGEQLADAVDKVAAGYVVASGDWPAPQARPDSRPLPGYCPLSARELAVVRQIAAGLQNKGIARALGISDQTVKNHITAIQRKLGVGNRAQVAVYCLERMWVAYVTTEPPARAGADDA